MLKSRVTVVIPCKGRLHHLKQTRDAWLSQDARVEYSVLVVDYGCPNQTFEWCKDNGLSCIKVKDNVEEFNLNRCRNIGIRHSNSSVVAVIDVDLIPPPYFISKALCYMALQDAPYLHYAVHSSPTIGGWEHYSKPPLSVSKQGIYGSFVPSDFSLICSFMRKELWESVRGYDEGFSGWGFDDVDFRERVIAKNTKDCLIGGEFTWINHLEEESVKFYTNKNREDTREKNLARLMNRARSINPEGYGISEDYESHENNFEIKQ